MKSLISHSAGSRCIRGSRTALAGFVTASLLLSLAACGSSGATSASSGTTTITIAEPIHAVSYLPLYAAIDTGAFKKQGIVVKTSTLTGGAHVNAVLNNSAWAFIGGPESGAIANAKGADLVAIGDVVSRATVYWAASPSSGVTASNLASSLKGKRLAVGRHGGSPEVITQYELKKLGLDPDKDVTLVNNDVSGSELSLVKSGQADVAVTMEPVLSQGIDQGIWGDPILNAPKDLGEYPYSAIVTSRSNADKNPTFTREFLKALQEGMDIVTKNHDKAIEIAQKEFPSMSKATIKKTLDRGYDDDWWSGMSISDDAEELNLTVARNSGSLKDNGKITAKTILDLKYLP